MIVTRGQKIFKVFNYIIITLIVLTALYPFMHQLSVSMSTSKEAYRPGFHFFPRPGHITLSAYVYVFGSKLVWRGYMNTIIRTVCGTLLALLVYGLFAYPLSKSRMPFVKLFTTLLVITMLFQGGLIPNYIIMKKLGLIDTRLVLMLQGVVSAFNIIVMRNFFKSIPEEMEESVKIDGGGDFRIFFRIIVPLSLPVLSTIGLWTAVWHWNMWFDSMIYITTKSKQVLQIVLREILILNEGDLMSGIRMEENRDFAAIQMKAAVIMVSVIPVIVVYPFIQKYFVKGIMLGAVKG